MKGKESATDFFQNQSILGNISETNCLWKFSRLKSSSNLGLLQTQTPSQADMSVTAEFSV